MYLTVPSIPKEVERQVPMEREAKKKNPTLFLTKQWWSLRYKVSVLSTCGGCHREGLIITSFYNSKNIANNHSNNNNYNDTNNN